MMFRLPSPLPIDWGRFELGPPVGDAGAALDAALGALLATPVEAAGALAAVLAAGALVALPVQAPTSRLIVATMINPVRCFIAPPPSRSCIDRQAVLALP